MAWKRKPKKVTKKKNTRGASKVDEHGNTIKNFKEWRLTNPDALYHDSKLEYNFYQELLKRGIEFDYQVKYTIQPSFKFNEWCIKKVKKVDVEGWHSKSIQPITWSPDFLLTKYNILIEAKGKPNEAFPNKLKQFKYYCYINGLDLKVIVLHSHKALCEFLDKGLND